jgi:hypothetical protein
VGSLAKEHREYTRNREEWQEKLPRLARPLAWGDREEAGKVSDKRQWPVALGHLNARPPDNYVSSSTCVDLSPAEVYVLLLDIMQQAIVHRCGQGKDADRLPMRAFSAVTANIRQFGQDLDQ